MKMIGRLSLILMVFSLSCEHDPVPGPASVRKWEDVLMQANFEVPAVPGRNEEGDASLELLSNNSLVYTFHIHNLKQGDVLNAAHIHAGDAGTGNGKVLINLNPSFVGSGATGVVTNLRQGQIDSLLNMPVYINVHSAQVNSGLVRGQLDKNVALAMDIPLSGNNEVPPVTTTASGNAILRLTEDKVLYSIVSFNNLESDDTVTVSHIHRGGAGANGGVRIFLCSDTTDFGKLKISAPLHDTVYHMLTTDPMYVNIHSRRHGPGLLRGQVR